MAANQPAFSPKQVAEALCVSESSVKRWCDCGAISIEKTAGGHRKITLEALQSFMDTTHRRIEHPEAIGMPQMLPFRQVAWEGKSSPVNDVFRNALVSGDEHHCRDLLHRVICEGTPRSQAAGCLITDAMHGIGHAWDTQQVDVYQERRACDIAMRMISELRQALPPVAAGAPIAIGGSPAGDPYQLPTALVELTLREAGWNATSLGSNLPLSSFHQAAVDCGADLVWMSVSTIDDVDTFVAQQNEIAASLGKDVALILGGRALTDSIRPHLRYTAYCDSLSHLVDLAAIMYRNHQSKDESAVVSA